MIDIVAQMIADMNNESKLWKEQQMNLEQRMNAFESRLQQLEQNWSTMPSNSKQSAWNEKIEQMITVIDNQIGQLNRSLVNLTESIGPADQPVPETQTLSTSLESNQPTGTGRVRKKVLGNVTESDAENHM